MGLRNWAFPILSPHVMHGLLSSRPGNTQKQIPALKTSGSPRVGVGKSSRGWGMGKGQRPSPIPWRLNCLGTTTPGVPWGGSVAGARARQATVG